MSEWINIIIGFDTFFNLDEKSKGFLVVKWIFINVRSSFIPWVSEFISEFFLTSVFNVGFITYCFPPPCRCATEGPQKGLDLSANVPVGNSPSAAAAAEAPAASAQHGSTSAPLEPQNSTIRSEVMPSSPVVIHHVQSSPVHMQQSQQSAALTAQLSPPLTPSPPHVPSPNPSKGQDRESPKAAAFDPPSPTHHKKTHGNPMNNGNGAANQGLIIEELQNSQDKSKNRAMSIEVCLITFQLPVGLDLFLSNSKTAVIFNHST